MKRNRTFKKLYFSSLFALLILISAMTGLLIWQIGENLKDEERQLIENKAEIIAENMDVQMDNIYKIARQVSNLQIFQKKFLRTNKYNEIKLLDMLGQYKYSIPITEYYFVKYSDSDIVFSSEGKTERFNVYYESEIGKKGYDEFVQELDRLSLKGSEEKIIVYVNGKNAVFICPMINFCNSKIGRDGVLCFIMKERDIGNYFINLIGEMKGGVSVYYQNCCIYDEEIQSYKNAVHVRSRQEKVDVYVDMTEFEDFSWSNILDFRFWSILIFFLCLAIVLGFALANYNFKPFKRILEKYDMKGKYIHFKNWDGIDQLLDMLFEGRERNLKVIQEQCKALKSQLIRLIIMGKYDTKLQEYITLFGIRLKAPVYGIIKCRIIPSDTGSFLEQDICDAIEEISDDKMVLHAYMEDDITIYVLAAVEEEYQVEEIKEFLVCLMEAKELYSSLEVIGITHDLKNINQKLIVMGDNSGRSREIKKNEIVPCNNKSTVEIEVILKYLENNYSDFSLSLDMVAQEFGFSTSHMCKIIKQQTGKGYKELLTELRMERAKELLETQSIKVSDVCVKVGYNNVPNFIKMFQKYTGMTPANYRQAHKKS